MWLILASPLKALLKCMLSGEGSQDSRAWRLTGRSHSGLDDAKLDASNYWAAVVVRQSLESLDWGLCRVLWGVHEFSTGLLTGELGG